LKPVGRRPRANEDEECTGLERRPRSRWVREEGHIKAWLKQDLTVTALAVNITVC
jgi:hypothetical protein